MATLLVGYTASDLFERGKHGKKFTASWLNEDVTCHCLDIYHRHAIEKTHHVKAICTPHLPEGPWDVIRFKTGPKRMSGELALDQLQEIHLLMRQQKPAPKFELVYDGKERDRNDLLNKIKDDPDRVRDFSATWKASVPGIDPLTFTSFPGCFCHRRQDEGGLALAEVVSKDLSSSIQHSSLNPRRLLDMGCGCGLVGLLIARAVKGVSLVGVDSHSRAIEAANLNAQALGVEAEMILSDNGTPARMDGTFDVFVGNPPYYSDYRIAEVFLDTAKRALKPGGVCYTVCKNAAGLEPVQRQYFPDVEIIKRRGYAVLKSIKPL
ncbi:MAG: methyltransferase [Kiritimatiellia bacterium]|nr:methyltransferase [Kiritimatiellia bacterium]